MKSKQRDMFQQQQLYLGFIFFLFSYVVIQKDQLVLEQGLNAGGASLVSINLSLSFGRCPGFAVSQSTSVGSIRAPRKGLRSSINVTIQSAICADAVGRSGHCVAPLPSAFHFTLQNAVHIKVVIETPQSEILVWQGSKVFKKRMTALT